MVKPPPPPALRHHQVRCAGCRTILTVAPLMTEFICPTCKLPQRLPPEMLSPPPPPPPPMAPIKHPPSMPLAQGIDPTKIQLPCANCKAILNVPHGLARFMCPQCGVDLAVDASKFKRFAEPPPPEEVNEVAIDVEREEDEGGTAGETFTDYFPPKLSIGRPHPDPIVETSSLSAVQPPEPTYDLKIKDDLEISNALSCLQIETIVYASQRHLQKLHTGTRAGFFVGDGAGVGKGRTVAGLIWENWHHGRRKALWVSIGSDLKFDARRDLDDVGAKCIEVHALNKLPYSKLDSKSVGVKEGVIFMTYSSLIASSERGRTRLQQLVQWCGSDYEGLVVFDECHKAKNLIPEAGSQPTRTGKVVVELQERLPQARVIYCSATGASEPRNLGYMVRLGLWGPGTCFLDFRDFLGALDKGGVGALELVAMDMKARGMYVCRTLSYKGAEFDVIEAPLEAEMLEMYKKAAEFWAELRVELLSASTVVPDEKPNSGQLWRLYWSSHQRFFRHMCMSAKVPVAVRLAKQALKENKCVVIGLQSIGEARTEEAVTKYGVEMDDFVSGPRELLLKFVEENYPLPPKPESLLEEESVKELKRKRHSTTSGRGRVRKIVNWKEDSDAESEKVSESEFEVSGTETMEIHSSESLECESLKNKLDIGESNEGTEVTEEPEVLILSGFQKEVTGQAMLSHSLSSHQTDSPPSHMDLNMKAHIANDLAYDLDENCKASQKNDKDFATSSRGIGFDLNADGTSKSASQNPFNPYKLHGNVKSTEASECGSSTGPIEENDSYRKWKEMKRNGFLSSAHGGIPIPSQAQPQRAKKRKNDCLKKKMEIAKREQVHRFTKVAAPSGLLNGLNPGIINHVRNSKQVHSIIEALVRSERRENGSKNRSAGQLTGVTDTTEKGRNSENIHDSGESLPDACLKTEPTNNLFGNMQTTDYPVSSSIVNMYSISEHMGRAGNPELAERRFCDEASGASHLTSEHGNELLALKLSPSINLTSENDEANQASVSSLSARAATVASQWLELLHQDIRGRLSALRRSKKRVQAVIQTELPFLILKEFPSTQENDPSSGQHPSSKCPNTAVRDMHRARWTALFDQVDKTLTEEGKHLEAWLNQVKEMQLQCERGLQGVNWQSLQALGGRSEIDPRSKAETPEKELALRAAAASIYSTWWQLRTALLCCCSPSTSNASESLSTLRFGARAKHIRTSPRVNSKEDKVDKKQPVLSPTKDESSEIILKSPGADCSEDKINNQPIPSPTKDESCKRILNKLRETMDDEQVNLLEELFIIEGILFHPNTVEDLESAYDDAISQTIALLQQAVEELECTVKKLRKESDLLKEIVLIDGQLGPLHKNAGEKHYTWEGTQAFLVISVPSFWNPFL